jgi:thiamine pyrophosphokinase
MATDRGLFTPVAPAAGKTARRFSSHAGEAVSLFADSPQTRVTVRGLHWPLDAASLPRWWSGTLNVSEGDAFDVEAEHGVVLVYQAYA